MEECDREPLKVYLETIDSQALVDEDEYGHEKTRALSVQALRLRPNDVIEIMKSNLQVEVEGYLEDEGLSKEMVSGEVSMISEELGSKHEVVDESERPEEEQVSPPPPDLPMKEPSPVTKEDTSSKPTEEEEESDVSEVKAGAEAKVPLFTFEKTPEEEARAELEPGRIADELPEKRISEVSPRGLEPPPPSYETPSPVERQASPEVSVSARHCFCICRKLNRKINEISLVRLHGTSPVKQ
uniref:TPR_REGION domain-containing protein n=1 Tax=Mesocestoides corti TaxID=53468 RepID=A0A5K3EWU9_MESCO